MPWPFSRKPKRTDVKFWLNWAEDHMQRGVSRQEVWDRLSFWDIGKPPHKIDGAESMARQEASRRIGEEMVNRNLTGRELERQGKVDQAIALYEANLDDGFNGNHPYERLRIIYAGRKDFHEAIRVCQAFVNLPHRSNTNPRKVEHFKEWVKKYKARLE